MKTAKFTTNDYCKVFDENDVEIPWGSETPGFIAFGGPIPLGYYKDEEKTAKTFKTINGQRFSIPGDYCLVSPEGELTCSGVARCASIRRARKFTPKRWKKR